MHASRNDNTRIAHAEIENTAHEGIPLDDILGKPAGDIPRDTKRLVLSHFVRAPFTVLKSAARLVFRLSKRQRRQSVMVRARKHLL